MKSYLVTLTPLEPYFLGGERTFHFKYRDRENNYREYKTPTTAPDTYFISSEKLPNQTALLGVLRYALLDKEGLLWHGGEPSGQRQRRSELVGESSFSVDAENSFGRIGEISPIFLRRESVSYIRTPANYGIAEGGLCFEPMLSSEAQVPGNYKAKGHPIPTESFLPLTAGAEPVSPFYSDVRVGINAKRDKKAFFKKEYCMLEDGFSFAFYAALDDGLSLDGYASTVFMGQGKSPFRISFCREENALTDTVKEALPRERNTYWYALSDLWISENLAHKGFAIVTKKQMRYLTTTLDGATRHFDRLKKTAKLFNLVQAGSVFYYDPTNISVYRSADCIGMNQLIKIESK